jgi:hypothetical protein
MSMLAARISKQLQQGVYNLRDPCTIVTHGKGNCPFFGRHDRRCPSNTKLEANGSHAFRFAMAISVAVRRRIWHMQHVRKCLAFPSHLATSIARHCEHKRRPRITQFCLQLRSRRVAMRFSRIRTAHSFYLHLLVRCAGITYVTQRAAASSVANPLHETSSDHGVTYLACMNSVEVAMPCATFRTVPFQ